MRKRLLVALTLTLCITSMPMMPVQAAKTTTNDTATTTGVNDKEGEIEEGIECILIKEEFVVTPAKKTIKVGESFYIDIVSNDSGWEEFSEEEWEEFSENNIDSISFRSTRKSVASVNKRTGKVKAKKKGNAVIKTTINLVNGESLTFKTKVYVTR